MLSEASEENVVGVVTSAVPEQKDLNAEEVTTMTFSFLKRIGHKGEAKPKRVSLEEGTYTVECEMKKFTATVRIDAITKEVKEYDVQPKGEESSTISFSPKIIMTVGLISGMIHIALYFVLKIIGL